MIGPSSGSLWQRFSADKCRRDLPSITNNLIVCCDGYRDKATSCKMLSIHLATFSLDHSDMSVWKKSYNVCALILKHIAILHKIRTIIVHVSEYAALTIFERFFFWIWWWWQWTKLVSQLTMENSYSNLLHVYGYACVHTCWKVGSEHVSLPRVCVSRRKLTSGK